MLTRLERERRMIAKLLLQNLIWVVAMGALLFVPAGTLHWPAAWVFLGDHGDARPCRRIVARQDRSGAAGRAHAARPMQEDQPAADKKFVLVFGVDCPDLVRRDRPRPPLCTAPTSRIALQALGLAMLYLLSTGFIMWVMRENSFAAPVVKVQTERGHHVISTGPYAWVRHPMYSGAMLFFVGMPLLLGSWWGVAMAPLFVVLFAIRTGIEERALIAGLPGYADYTARVRYRLVPGFGRNHGADHA